MSKLTSERVNGIKTGYWSPYTKEVICQRLGQIEHKAPALIGQICDYCLWPNELSEDDLAEKCKACPLHYLDKLIAGDYPAGM